jgi:hypothetical protein
MGGKYWTDDQCQHRSFDRLGCDAKLAQFAHRPARGRRLGIGYTLAQVGIPPAHTVRLLGGVDKQKKERERACRHSALRDGESVDQPQQPVEGWRVFVAVPPTASRDPQSLDDRERLVTFEPPDYASECARKPPDVLVEREIFFARSGRVWHGRKIPQSSASEKATTANCN